MTSSDAVELALLTETNPRRRANLLTLEKHFAAAAHRDAAARAATLAQACDFTVWQAGVDVGPKGRAAAKTYYEGLYATPSRYLGVKLREFLIGDDFVIFEGEETIVRGPADIESSEDDVVVNLQICTIWRFSSTAEITSIVAYPSSGGGRP